MLQMAGDIRNAWRKKKSYFVNKLSPGSVDTERDRDRDRDRDRAAVKRKLPAEEKPHPIKYQKSIIEGVGGGLGVVSTTKTLSGVFSSNTASSSGPSRLIKGKIMPEKYDDELAEMSVTEGKLFWAICMFRDGHVQALMKRFLSKRLEKDFMDGKVPSTDLFVKQGIQLIEISLNEKPFIPSSDLYVLRVCIPGLMLLHADGDTSASSYSSYLNELFGLDEEGKSLIADHSMEEIHLSLRKVNLLLSLVSFWTAYKPSLPVPSRTSGTEP